MSSASPRTGILALCVEKTNWRRRFSCRMIGTTPSVIEAVVEIVFRLIDHERCFRFEQQEQQDGGRLFGRLRVLAASANWPVPRREPCSTRSPSSQEVPVLRYA